MTAKEILDEFGQMNFVMNHPECDRTYNAVHYS